MIIAYWHWLIFGFAMVTIEVLAPGAFFLWVGIAAFILGGVIFFVPTLSTASQLFFFGSLALIITILGRKIIHFYSRQAPLSVLNKRRQQLIGEVITLDVPIVNGHAHVSVGDSKWIVKGPDAPAGTCVKVIDVEGNRLIVVVKGT